MNTNNFAIMPIIEKVKFLCKLADKAEFYLEIYTSLGSLRKALENSDIESNSVIDDAHDTNLIKIFLKECLNDFTERFIWGIRSNNEEFVSFQPENEDIQIITKDDYSEDFDGLVLFLTDRAALLAGISTEEYKEIITKTELVKRIGVLVDLAKKLEFEYELSISTSYQFLSNLFSDAKVWRNDSDFLVTFSITPCAEQEGGYYTFDIYLNETIEFYEDGAIAGCNRYPETYEGLKKYLEDWLKFLEIE